LVTITAPSAIGKDYQVEKTTAGLKKDFGSRSLEEYKNDR